MLQVVEMEVAAVQTELVKHECTHLDFSLAVSQVFELVQMLEGLRLDVVDSVFVQIPETIVPSQLLRLRHPFK